jgi:hypothetical protein
MIFIFESVGKSDKCSRDSPQFFLSSALCYTFLLWLPLTNRSLPDVSLDHLYAQQDNQKDSNLSGPTLQPPRPNYNTYCCWAIPNELIAGKCPGDR